MFLTVKGLVKIISVTVAYFVLGGGCIAFSHIFENMGAQAGELEILGFVCFALGVFSGLCGYYTESKGRLINSGHRFINRELKPGVFIKIYEAFENSKKLVINKPSFEALQMAATAYDLLGDKENTLATVEKMLASVPEKKKARVRLFNVSFLFSYGRGEEAEALFNEVKNGKTDFMCKALADAIVKGDRALFFGDYALAEAYYSSEMLCRKFPKPDNVTRLIAHYNLGELYEKTDDAEKAHLHYGYCAKNGGETALRLSAEEKLKSLGGECISKH